jgi:PAS domain S-box-containing protein
MGNRRTSAPLRDGPQVASGVPRISRPDAPPAEDRNGAPVGDQEEPERFASAVARVVAKFAASPGTMEQQLEPALVEFIHALDIERSTLYLTTNGRVYCAAKPGIRRVEAINAADFTHTWTTLTEKGAFMFSSAEELPATATGEREYFRQHGPASLLAFPLIAGGGVFGGVAFETVTFRRSWTEEMRQRLKLLADVLASALAVKHAKEELDAQLRFERCISDVSASLVNMRPDTADHCIRDALRRIGEVLSLERIGFFERNPDSDHFLRTHVWIRTGASPVPWPFLRDQSKEFASRLISGQIISYSSLAEMPAHTATLREYLERHGIRSFLVLPLKIGGRVVAALSIASVDENRAWDEALIRRLTLLGETLSNAVVHHHQDQVVASQQDRLRLAMRATRAHGWDWNLESGKSVWFGDSESIFGLPPEAHTGGIEDFMRQVHPDDHAHLQQALDQAIHKQVPYDVEYRVVRTDGQVRWLSDRGEVLFGSDGKAARMVGIAIDITDRKEMEKSRVTAEAHYGQLLETVDAIVWRAYPDSACYSFVSGQVEHILGYPLERWLQEPNFWANHLHPEDRDRVLQACAEDVAQGKAHVLEYRIIAADGRIVWLHDKTRIVTDRGKPVELVGIMVDITPLKEAEERLRLLGARLIEAQELERSRIARELHDDINQRLALIAIELEDFDKRHLQKNKQFRAYSRSLWTKTSDVTSRISRLCGLLHSSKLEHLGLVPAVRDLCAVVSENQGIRIDVSVRSLPHRLPADVALCLFRICQESLANAIKHGGCSRARVRLQRRAGAVELTVTDNGCGFDFDTRGGTGLGLISMQERASLLGGTFSVKSGIGSGTTVFARVPVPTAPASESSGTGTAS